MEGSSGLGDRGISRQFQMGEENPAEGRVWSQALEVGVIVAAGEAEGLPGRRGSWGPVGR